MHEQGAARFRARDLGERIDDDVRELLREALTGDVERAGVLRPAGPLIPGLLRDGRRNRQKREQENHGKGAHWAECRGILRAA